MNDLPPEQNDPEAPEIQPASPMAEDDLQFIAAKTLAGDVRDFLLDRLRHDHSPLPWHLRGEDEQQRTIDAADEHSRLLVAKVVDLVMAGGRRTIMATFKKAAIKDHIACELHVPITNEDRHALLDSVGEVITLTLADTRAFNGDRGKPKPTPDQRGLFPDDPEGPDDGPVFDKTPSGRKG